ncbi:tetratricopeptide repeat protein [Streptomyces sp. PanSC19]|uniref:CHAT domain-containing protein n=1 Tax=Streptomyces sp. PanSC19 TaxID=1520455 RepID=UPI000F47FCC3|nr:CHAT domain-containing protein [Streptomyces sp. PanSC19]ROQ35102.1 tetratricopeptide repeat protein [Streptomyces sp. PanSC19]
MFGWALIRLWAAERGEVFGTGLQDGAEASRERILRLGSRPAKELHRELGALSAADVSHLLGDLVRVAEGAGTFWQDRTTAAALGDVLASVGLDIGLRTDDRALADDLLLESHVMRGVAAAAGGEHQEALRQFDHACRRPAEGTSPLARVLGTIGQLVSSSDGGDADSLRSAVAEALGSLDGRESEERRAVRHAVEVRLAAQETAARSWAAEGPESAGALLSTWLTGRGQDEAFELARVCARRLIDEADEPEAAAARARLLDAVFLPHLSTSTFQEILADVYRRHELPHALLTVLEAWCASEPGNQDLGLRLAEAYRQVGEPARGAAVLRPLVTDPPVPGEERLVHLLAVLLSEAGSPDADRWQEHFARLLSDERMAANYPSEARAFFPTAPRPAPLAARYEDGTLTIDPSIAATLTSEQVSVHVTAAMIVGSPDGEEMFRTLAADSPDVAARVAELLGIVPRQPPVAEGPPTAADALLHRGEAHFARREFPQAIACYVDVLRREPDHAMALLFLGDAYYVQDQFAVARVYFEESLAVEETPMAWRFLGDTLRKTSAATSEVRSCYERALALDPGYGGARQALASLPPEPAPGPSAGDRGRPGRREEGRTPVTEAPAPEKPSLPRRLRLWLRRPAAATAGKGGHAGSPSAAEDEPNQVSPAGVEYRLPAQLEALLRDREPWAPGLLDALADDDAFVQWQNDLAPEHFASVVSSLMALAWQWNAKAGNGERALLIARRRLQVVAGLPFQWLEGAPHFAGRALLVSQALEQQAGLLTDLGRYGEAFEALREAEAWLEEDRRERERTGRPQNGWPAASFLDQNPRADLYQRLAAAAARCGDDDASEHYRRMADQWRAGTPDSDHDRITALCLAALDALGNGEPDDCFRLLDEALPLAVREAGWKPVGHALALVHHTRAQALLRLGPSRTALEHVARARRHNSGNADRLVLDWLLTAEILGAHPRLGDPLEAYEHALQLSGVPAVAEDALVWCPRHGTGGPVRIENAERAWRIVTPMAQAAWAAGEPETAVRVLELGTQLSDLVRAAQPDPDLRRRLQEERAEVYELLLQYRLDSGVAGPGAADLIEAAFATTERLRSRTLLDTLSTAELRPPEGVPADLIGRESALLRERAALERAPRTDWERLRSVQRELGNLWSAMASHHGPAEEYAEIRAASAITASSALARLHEDRAVVASYARLNDGRFVLFTLDPRTGLAVTPIDVDGVRLARFIEDNLGGAGQVREMAVDMPGLFQQVLSPLVAPLAGLTGPEDTIVICPTGPLHQVPFHALSVEGNALLIERNAVAYLPSVSLLRTLSHRESRTGRGAVVLGDPGGDLPYAREEARLLAGRLGTEPLLGAEATRQRVLDAMAGAGILHAACHAAFRTDDPLSSGLVLADGSLTGRDILREDWHGVRLAVLSACETGLGGADRTDEVLGLSRSLLFAGVRSLVMSLWRVPDRSTAFLMGTFHDLTLSGEPPAQALRAAMLAARALPGGSRLDRWAAFCLLGEWRAAPGRAGGIPAFPESSTTRSDT